MKTIVRILCAATLGAGLIGTAPAATYTDGTATFTVTLSDPAGNYSNVHVDAVWVTDAAGHFIKSLRKDAAARQGYLSKWNAARGNWSQIDGYTGATAPNYNSPYNPITVTWNCRDTNSLIVPDGDYRFYVEFTDYNGQGPWTTNGITFTKGTNAVSNTYPDLQNISNLQVAFTPIITHDIAVTSLSPTVGNPGAMIPVRVTVSNLTSFAESFTVVVSNLTLGSLLGSQSVNPLAGNTSTNLTFNWDTTGVPTGAYVLQAVAGPLTNETSTADNTRTGTLVLRSPTHDVAVTRITAPPLVLSNGTATVTVATANPGDFTETFSARLFDDTDGRLIGSNQVANVTSFGTANVNFTWRATNTVLAYHTLRAVAGPVAGEADFSNNTNRLVVPVASGVATKTFIARGSTWRYNDKGIDLTATPWNQPGYYDLFWSNGPAPLGYSDNGAHTNITTSLSWGPVQTNKLPTYYFRQTFYADALPGPLTFNIRRDDGVVLYLNGSEILRNGMPAGPINYATWANQTISEAAQYAYNQFTNVTATNMVLGANTLAVEVHQVNATSSDIVLDVEMLGNAPRFPPVHDVDVAAVAAGGDVVAGDRMPLTITVTNRGNVTETVLVVLKDTLTGQIVGSQTLAGVGPATAASVRIDWATVGAATGAHALQAFTVVGGVTNLAGAATGSAVISGSGFTFNPVNAAGAIGGRCAALDPTSNLLVVGAGASLEVWDRSAPAAPLKVGAVRLPGLIEGLAVNGAWAYVACGNAGVQFVDFSVPARPLSRNTFNTSGHAYGVAVGGNYLYVADGSAGIRIVNIADPLAPSLAGAYYTAGPARAIAVAGTRAYVLDQHQGLLVLDVANPGAPSLSGLYTGLGGGQAISLAGSTAYAVDDNNHFYVLNVAHPSAPTLTGSLLLTGMIGQALAVNGTTVYVAAGDNGLLAINAATPSAPAIASTVATPGQAVALALAGSTLYVADGFAGFQVFNATAPASPVLQADFPTALRAADVVVTNNLACVAAGEAGLRIFTVTNPVAPVLLGRFTGATNARSVAVSGSVAYVGDGQYGLKIVDVSNPAAPTLLGASADPNLGYIRNVGAAGPLVVTSDGRTLCLLDASTPANPVLVGTYAAPAFAFGLAIADSKAYVACGTAGLIILEVAPGGLEYLGGCSTPGLASGVSVSGNRAYVAGGAGGWLILDVSNPAAPSLVNTSVAQGPVYDVAVSGTLATLATGGNGAVTMDITAPLTPVATRSFGPLVRAMRLAAQGVLAVTAEDEAGLAILSHAADIDQDGLPDAWEQQIITASVAANGPIRSIWDVRPNDDFDVDGASNLAEYLAGTSPIDPASVFVLAVQGSADGAAITLRWHSIPGKIYTIYKTTDLAAGFSVFKDDIAATPPLNTETDLNNGSAAFYIISLR